MVPRASWAITNIHRWRARTSKPSSATSWLTKPLITEYRICRPRSKRSPGTWWDKTAQRRSATQASFTWKIGGCRPPMEQVVVVRINRLVWRMERGRVDTRSSRSTCRRSHWYRPAIRSGTQTNTKMWPRQPTWRPSPRHLSSSQLVVLAAGRK